MSQIARAIQYCDTGDRKIRKEKLSPLFDQMVDVKSTWEDGTKIEPLVLKMYRIQLTLRNQFAVSELELTKSKTDAPIAEGVNRAKRQMIEAVFGEFRPYFRQIEQAIYEYNMEEAGRLLHKMEDVMFEME